jgi:O-antigen ligase
MRRVALILLLLFAFTVPWEYSADFGAPWGNVSRVTGLLLLLAAVPAALQAGRIRVPGAMQGLVLAFYLWFCCSLFWSVDQTVTVTALRAYFQEMMIVWLVWEFTDTPRDLRALLRAFLAGCWILAILTVVDFRSPDAQTALQFRFAAYGQDPNDVARFLDLGFPFAALFASAQSHWGDRLLGLGYLPLGIVGVLLTASRGGFLAAAVALAGCAALLSRGNPKAALTGLFVFPPLAAGLWITIPRESFARLATIPEQLRNGDLNQRLNIWTSGWHAFLHAPIFGSGAGTFVAAAHLASIDTAHNTALSIVVGGGLIGLLLASAILVCAFRLLRWTSGSLRLAFLLALLVWIVASLVGTVEENRVTWLLFAMIAAAARLAEEAPVELAGCFPDRPFNVPQLAPVAVRA